MTEVKKGTQTVQKKLIEKHVFRKKTKHQKSVHNFLKSDTDDTKQIPNNKKG